VAFHDALPSRPPERPRQVCRYLELRQRADALPRLPSLEAVFGAFQAPSATFTCGLRGPRLAACYVDEVCASAHVDDCVFLEDLSPPQSGGDP
jgi:hypothetical protein